MPYEPNQPTYNTGDRKIVNFKDFHSEEEEAELKDIKRNITKNDAGQGYKAHKYKFNKVTRKMDDMMEDEVDDSIEALEVSEKAKVPAGKDPYKRGTKPKPNTDEVLEEFNKKRKKELKLNEYNSNELSEEKTSSESLICPYCNVEQADSPENLMSGGGGMAAEFADCECDTCGKKFEAAKVVTIEYVTRKID